ncbi:unnamed protein product [Macrosiphum euphorbiae]|uniref:SEA domain-containing protein n=1 Tax=Macrosiphum euphorbiae TaxID=13131 RepID=A0AAV0XS16_9HEMI|nr:unnamed protein product [Macrosiphum euphorbiae]
MTFGEVESEEEIIGKLLESKFQGGLQSGNITIEIRDEFYLPNFDYISNLVRNIQIKCQAFELRLEMQKKINEPRTYYTQELCEINIIGRENGGGTIPGDGLEKKINIFTKGQLQQPTTQKINVDEILRRMIKNRPSTTPSTTKVGQLFEQYRKGKKPEITIIKSGNSTITNNENSEIERTIRMKYSIIIGLMMLVLIVAITVLGIMGYKCKCRNKYDNYGITETQLDCDPRVDTTKL